MTGTVRNVLWANETHLPAWPPGPAEGMTARAVMAVVRRLSTAREIALGPAGDETSGGDAA